MQRSNRTKDQAIIVLHVILSNGLFRTGSGYESYCIVSNTIASLPVCKRAGQCVWFSCVVTGETMALTKRFFVRARRDASEQGSIRNDM
jgi:hypothetical protein